MSAFRTGRFAQLTAWSALLLSMALCGGAAAHEEDAAVTAPPVPEHIPHRIEEGDIPARADTVSSDLRRVETFLQPQTDIVRIESSLGAREARIVHLQADLDRVSATGISSRRLTDQRVPWDQLGSELAHWNEMVQARYSALQIQRERLRDERRLWETTQQSALEDELAPELQRRVEALLARIADIERQVRGRRNEVGAIGDRITNTAEVVTNSKDLLGAIVERQRRQVLRANAAPLWKVLGRGELARAGPDLWSGIEYWWPAFRSYLDMRPVGFIGSPVLFAALLVLAFRLRRSARKQTLDGAQAEGAQVLAERPVSLALAFWILIATFVLMPASTLTDLMYLLTCVILVRLGGIALSPQLKGAVVGLVTLTILVRISSLIPDGSGLDRILLSSVSLLAFLVALKWVRGIGAAHEELSVFERALVLLAPAAVVLLGVAFVASVWGWVSLARLLTYGTVLSSISGFAWVVLVMSISALLSWSIVGRLGEALPSLRREQAVVERTVLLVLGVVALFNWGVRTLDRFEIYELARDYVTGLGAERLGTGSLELSIDGLVSAIVLVVATVFVARLVRFVLSHEVAPRLAIDTGAAESVITLTSYVIYGIGIASAASAAGLSGTQVAVVIGALSVGIGFGLQNIVSNFISGLILMFEQPIKVGDIVQTPEHWGSVTRIGIRASTIRSFSGAEIMVPNADLISKVVVNWTRSDKNRRIEVLIGVAYGSDPQAVLAILLRVATDHPLSLETPAPDAQMLSYGDSSLNFRVRLWTHMDNWIPLASDVTVAVGAALKEAGITIPFPQRDLHLKSIDPEASMALGVSREDDGKPENH
jgi:small-conductance mechanosensitive channel